MQKIILTSFLLSSYVLASTLSPTLNESSLVIYNSNIGLVEEKRDLKLNTTDTSIIYEDVARSINTDSVSVTIDPSVTLFSQQYRYDKLTQNKLLDAYIGKKVEIRQLKNRNEFKIITATLLSHNGSQAIVKTLDYKIITVPSANIRFDAIPQELITKPSLVWNINVSKNLETELEIKYLINNISFKSDYILNLDDTTSDLSGWLTLNNRSGKAFKNTNLSLLAGDINRANKRTPRVYRTKTRQVAMDAPEVIQKDLEGYHFYTIPFKVDLANNEKTQIKFLSKDAIKTTREYEATLNNPLYLMGERKSNVTQYLTLAPLDIPLPQGTIRTYSKVDSKSVLIGETNIPHTPKNTAIKLKLGKNFDIQVKQTLLKRDDTQERFDVSVAYSVANNSDMPKTISISAPFNKNSDSQIITKQNYKFTKGNLVTFTLDLQANETKKFQVQYKSKR
jgi:hypothetical protein